jgi:endonuclease/exonuclease/phosphatase (EEP) superfamily protein YafD
LEHPLENEYGIALYSQLEVPRAEVRAMVKEWIPSIDADIVLRNGHKVRLFAVHPNPPRPGEDTTKRDAELVLVGREVSQDETTVVVGDLNDVGWSRTTNLFQEVSGLLDPRRGRGFYATFNANSRIWRYPLDYVFHSDDFRVAELEVLPYIGSDHFPLWIQLSHEPAAKATQEAPQLSADDLEDAEEAVRAVK